MFKHIKFIMLSVQEGDLYKRATTGDEKARICMHTGTFVYHFKVRHAKGL